MGLDDHEDGVAGPQTSCSDLVRERLKNVSKLLRSRPSVHKEGFVNSFESLFRIVFPRSLQE